MRWMLDTNTLVYVLNARPQHQGVLDRFNDHDPQKLCLSSITLAELRFGVAQSHRRDETQKKLDRVIGALTVMPFEEDAAMAYGVLRATLQSEGQPLGPLGPLDTLIAGHALSEGSTRVTNNLREFCRVKGLRLENWITPA